MFNIESNVRNYSRLFPASFDSAFNAEIKDTEGNTYLDFLSGCGALNYGHNNRALQKSLLEYIDRDGVSMSLDLKTNAKEKFLFDLYSKILEPRNLDYRVQFSGPTGANAVEAAIKLARKVTGRLNIVAFTNAFHGCSLGALSLTANVHHRHSSKGSLNNVTRLPFDGYFSDGPGFAEMLDKYLLDESSGIDWPAAIIFECVQGEGGLNVLSEKWAKDLARVAKKHGILIIVDEIQTGCGRCGKFFSFERLGFVQTCANGQWNKKNPEVFETILNSPINTYRCEAGDAYLLRAKDYLHRVTPIQNGGERLIVNMTWASAKDLITNMTHETNDILFTENTSI